MTAKRAMRLLGLAADAEARGDVRAALEHLCRLPEHEKSFHVGRLAQLHELGETAPGWMWSRWITVQATRPLWSNATVEETGTSDLRHALSIAYPHGLDPGWARDLPRHLHASLVVEHDWMVRQVLVYESGRLDRFLSARASPALLVRADQPAAWAATPMGGYRLEPSEPGEVVVRDLATGDLHHVLDLGLAVCHDEGEHFLGRVVPIDAPPGLMFEWRPLPVDDMTAREVAAAPHRWVETVARRAEDRLLPVMFGYHEGELASDAPEIAWVHALLGESWDTWLPRRDGTFRTDDAVPFAVDSLLDEARHDLTRLRRIAPLVCDLLVRPGVDAVVRSAYAGEQHADAWSALASMLAEPAAGRCRRWALAGPAAA